MDVAPEVELDRFYSDLGRAVRLYREKSGMTQATLATRVGLTRSSIANLEAGRQRVMAHVVPLLSDVLGVPITDLIPEGDMESSRPFDVERLNTQLDRADFKGDERAFVTNVFETLS